MPVPFQEIQAAEIHALVPPKLLQQWGVHHDTEVFSFVVPELDFYVIGEQILPKPHYTVDNFLLMHSLISAEKRH